MSGVCKKINNSVISSLFGMIRYSHGTHSVSDSVIPILTLLIVIKDEYCQKCTLDHQNIKNLSTGNHNDNHRSLFHNTKHNIALKQGRTLIRMILSPLTESPDANSLQKSVFRSVLPHEPPIPDDEPRGYLHVQGLLTPKVQNEKETDTQDSKPGDQSIAISSEFWTDHCDELELTLLWRFRAVLSRPNDDTLLHIKLSDQTPPFTKVRLCFDSAAAARKAMLTYKNLKLTPQFLFATSHCEESESQSHLGSLLQQTANCRLFQISEVTCRPLPDNCPCWTRSTPPKFRRLVARPGEETASLESERQTTRFVMLANLLENVGSPPNHDHSTCWEANPTWIAHAVRSVLSKYDTSGANVEVFVPSNTSKRSRYCHVGFRSAADAQAALAALQEEVVEWPCLSTTSDSSCQRFVRSGKLFVDYAAITQRSDVNEDIQGTDVDLEKEKRLKGGPQCTSTTDHIKIRGLVLIPDFLSMGEEAAIMAVVNGPHAPWAPSQTTASHPNGVVRRAVQHYGYVFDYQTADVLRDRSANGADCPPMPAVSDDLLSFESHPDFPKLVEDSISRSVDEGRGWEVLAGVINRTRLIDFRDDDTNCSKSFPHLNQLTVNQYVPGDGIGSHVDTESAFSDGLISISLNGGIVMEFRAVDNGDDTKGSKKLVYLPPRSLLLMSKDARYKWEHMIVSRMTDTHNKEISSRKLRISLTLRTAISENGEVILPLIQSSLFPLKWGEQGTSTTWTTTPSCERNHVHAVYDAIATQWHHTRGKRGVLWPGATQFLQMLSPGSIVADVGCGDGKYFPAIWEAGSYVIGTDISEPLLRTAMHDGSNNDEDIPETRRISKDRLHLRNRPAIAVADCMNLPLRTSSCDAAICIAVLHHLSTVERRKRCIAELVRVVKPGGLVNVQAWALEQEDGSKRTFASNDIFVPFNAQPKYLQMNSKEEGDRNNIQDFNDTRASDSKSVAQIYSKALNAEYDDRKGLVVFNRYCHLYRKGELDQVALEVPGVRLLESGFESGNYFIIFEVQK